MCVCIKRLINSTSFREVSSVTLLVCSTCLEIPIILNPHWLQFLPVMGYGPPILAPFLWLQSVRLIPKDVRSWERFLQTQQKARPRESHSVKRCCSLCYCVSCMRIFLFPELKGGNGWHSHSDGRAPNVIIFLVSKGPFLNYRCTCVCSVCLFTCVWAHECTFVECICGGHRLLLGVLPNGSPP